MRMIIIHQPQGLREIEVPEEDSPAKILRQAEAGVPEPLFWKGSNAILAKDWTGPPELPNPMHLFSLTAADAPSSK